MRQSNRYNWLTLFLLFFTINSFAVTEEQSPPERGFYSLPDSQQPGSMIAFGQTLVAAKEIRIAAIWENLRIQQGHYNNLISLLDYGISDSTTIELALPYAFQFVEEGSKSSGLGDIYVQLEHSFYEKSTSTYEDQATVVSAIHLPSGSAIKEPATGAGAPSFYEGLTFSRTYENYNFFFTPGILLTTSNDGIHTGSSYFYELGLGRLIFAKPKQYIVAAILELDEQFIEKNSLFGEVDRDTGGKIFSLIPSLSYSNKHLVLQGGIAIPVLQRLNGIQNLNKYNILINIYWSFY